MALVKLDLPSPAQLRGGWAAMAAIQAAIGWMNDVTASADLWRYHDGGGNWAAVRFLSQTQAIMIGHDHEYSETYFRDAATYFEEEETDLLKDAPPWWGRNLGTEESNGGPWIGFIYGWDGSIWSRADYDKDDGFSAIGLLKLSDPAELAEAITAWSEASKPPGLDAVQKLIDADADLTPEIFEAVMPGHNTKAAVKAARNFLQAPLASLGE